jgi:hypothetical protein
MSLYLNLAPSRTIRFGSKDQMVSLYKKMQKNSRHCPFNLRCSMKTVKKVAILISKSPESRIKNLRLSMKTRGREVAYLLGLEVSLKKGPEPIHLQSSHYLEIIGYDSIQVALTIIFWMIRPCENIVFRDVFECRHLDNLAQQTLGMNIDMEAGICVPHGSQPFRKC